MTAEYHVITICQPHAWAVVSGPKQYENRTWRTKYRGLLLIHAGVSKAWLNDVSLYHGCPAADDLVFGSIVGAVILTGCVHPWETDGDPYAFGPWCHVYESRRSFARPIACPGAMSIWKLPAALVDPVEAALAALADAPTATTPPPPAAGSPRAGFLF